MNIGILTYHRPYNFGANLQAYTTTLYLKKLGHNPIILDYYTDEGRDVYRKMVPEIQWAAHDNFIEKNLPLSPKFKNKSELIEYVESMQFNGIIVGADAVWSWNKKLKEIPPYFLDWLVETPSIRKIPSATMSVAHMGNGFKHLTPIEREHLKNVIKRIDFISVRDKWTKYVINTDIFNGEEYVKIINPDPVIILKNLLPQSSEIHCSKVYGDYIVCTLSQSCYIMREWISKLRKDANERFIKLVELPLPEGVSGLNFDYTVPYPLDPLDWYQWIINSKGFIGFRFHSIISAISGDVPFFSIDSYGKNSNLINMLNHMKMYKFAGLFDYRSKIYQLLSDINMKDRRVHGIRGLQAINPSLVLKNLMNCDKKKIVSARESLANIYVSNMERLMNVFNN
jgi:hypothetical protein